MPRPRSAASVGSTAASITMAMTSSPAIGTGEYAPMPPVLGPVVAVADALEVLRRRQGHGPRAVADREHRELGAGQPLLDHHAAAGVAERLAGEVVADGLAGLGRATR